MKKNFKFATFLSVILSILLLSSCGLSEASLNGVHDAYFDDAVAKLKALDIPVIVHVILGLPGETKDMVLETIQYLNRLCIFGIKLQLLHVLKDTDLANDYLAGKFETLSKEDYMSLLISCLKQLSPDIVVHRLTGDGPKDLLIAPTWSLYKRDFFNTLHRHLKQTGEYQGQDFL